MTTKSKAEPMPKCAFCGKSGKDVYFNIFAPRFPPFGTACADCEKKLPPGTALPAKEAKKP